MLKKNPLAIVLGVSALFFVIFVVIAIMTVMNISSGRGQSKIFGRSSNLGVIEIKGVILDSKKYLAQLDKFGEDPLIKGVIIRVDSPGGGAAPSQEIYDGVRKLAKKKTVYSSMASTAASGGYYVACAAKKVYANPATVTGSIGVIMQFADLRGLFQWAKVQPYNLKTGKFKDVGSPHREMTVEDRALMQEMLDNILLQFRKAVASSRNLPFEKVIDVSDGRILTGDQAKAAKLVDELGGMSDAVDALAKEVGIIGKPNLVYASKKKRALERLLRDFDDDADSDTRSALSRGFDALVGAVGSDTGGGLVGPLFLMPHFTR